MYCLYFLFFTILAPLTSARATCFPLVDENAAGNPNAAISSSSVSSSSAGGREGGGGGGGGGGAGLVSGDGDFALLSDKMKDKYQCRVEVYGVPKLTAVALINSADQFYPIKSELLLK